MNRVTLTFAANGDIARICSDEPIELYWVCPHCPQDRVCTNRSTMARNMWTRRSAATR